LTGLIDEEIRRIVGAHGRLAVDASTLDEKADLFRLGMTSHASVNVMLALEESFDIEFPEEDLTQDTFRSVAAIRQSVSTLVGERVTT
jgi:acyl carrier protein